MERKIDWKLVNDKKVLVFRKNVDAVYKYQDYVLYKTDKEYNKYDIKANQFLRVTPEIHMLIDFNEQTCKFTFSEEESCKFDIKCKNTIKKNNIVLEYSIDESVKKIEIMLK